MAEALRQATRMSGTNSSQDARTHRPASRQGERGSELARHAETGQYDWLRPTASVVGGRRATPLPLTTRFANASAREECRRQFLLIQTGVQKFQERVPVLGTERFELDADTLSAF